MNEIEIDWKQERPTENEVVVMWDELKIEQLKNWSSEADILRTKFQESHTNGGVQLHKYGIERHSTLEWFSSRNRLNEIYFNQTLIRRPELTEYRANLKIATSKPKVKETKWKTDLFDLPATLARMLAQGGAYRKVDSKEAWDTAVNFIKGEFGARYMDFNQFDTVIEDSKWFFDVAWDYSTILFDKRNLEVVLVDITDTD